jgi:hypothetical protein
VEVDGDTATATLNGQPAPLIRVDGRWYLRAEF